MSNVTFSIGGRAYTVACAEGQEAHIALLGRMIDEKLADLGDTSALSEARMLLFGALHLADELHEARANGFGDMFAPTERATSAAFPEQAEARLEGIAATLENLADHLEGRAGNA